VTITTTKTTPIPACQRWASSGEIARELGVARNTARGRLARYVANEGLGMIGSGPGIKYDLMHFREILQREAHQ